MIARSRRPFRVVMSGVFSSAWACFWDNQFPIREELRKRWHERIAEIGNWLRSVVQG